jgi:hypothetical protein
LAQTSWQHRLQAAHQPPRTESEQPVEAPQLDRARAVGEAQVDLNRVRARRNALVAQLLADPKYKPLSTYKKRVRIMRMIDRVQRILGKPFDLDDIEPLPDFKPLEDHRKFATVMEDRVRVPAALDRYERRAPVGRTRRPNGDSEIFP